MRVKNNKSARTTILQMETTYRFRNEEKGHQVGRLGGYNVCILKTTTYRGRVEEEASC